MVTYLSRDWLTRGSLDSVPILSRCSLIVADMIVLAVTWVKLRGQVKEALDLDLAATISTVMLADGMRASPSPFLDC